MRLFPFLTALFCVLATPAFAHLAGSTGSFAAGFAHPFGGADHLAAIMLAGLWSVLAGGTATIAWPVTFVAAMLGGFAAASAGLQIGSVEEIVGLSVILLGAFTAFELRLPVMPGTAVIGLFAFFHGHAHGMEAMPMLVPYAAGFTMATIVLLAVGMVAAVWAKGSAGRLLVRAAGGSAALAGVLLLRGVS